MWTIASSLVIQDFEISHPMKYYLMMDSMENCGSREVHQFRPPPNRPIPQWDVVEVEQEKG